MMDAKAEALVARLHGEVAKLVSGNDWQAVLKLAAKFHQYSASNILLIRCQRPDATYVAGFRQWQKLGRSVRKGEKGIAILAPLIRKSPVLNEATGREETRACVYGFRVVYVFDYAQTDGQPLNLDHGLPVHLTGDAPESLRNFLIGQIQADGFQLEFPAEWEDSANGWTDFRIRGVAIRPGMSPAQTAKTLTHELAHIRLHEDGAVSRAIAEVEAESVAAVVMAAVGIDSASYSLPYLTAWSNGDLKLILQTATRVVAAASVILDALTRGGEP